MGWFLTKNAKKPKKAVKKSGRGKGAKPSWDPARTLMGLKASGYAAGVVALVLGWHFMERGLDGYVSSNQPALDIRLKHVPSEVDQRTSDEIILALEGVISLDPLDDQSLRDAVAMLEDHPSVKRVLQVQRFRDNLIHVTAEYREPVAYVITRDGYRKVDAEGVLLPGVYEAYQTRVDGEPLVIGGVPSETEPARTGEAWAHPDLVAGIELAMLLRHESYAGQIRLIDVSQKDRYGQPRIALRTERGAVVWGQPVNSQNPTEAGAADKLQNLRNIVARTGKVDAGGKVVRIYGPQIWMDNQIGEQGDTQFVGNAY